MKKFTALAFVSTMLLSLASCQLDNVNLTSVTPVTSVKNVTCNQTQYGGLPQPIDPNCPVTVSKK